MTGINHQASQSGMPTKPKYGSQADLVMRPKAPWPTNSAQTAMRKIQWTCRSWSTMEDMESCPLCVMMQWTAAVPPAASACIAAGGLERPRLDHLDDLVTHRLCDDDVRAVVDAGPDRGFRDLVRDCLHRGRVAWEEVAEHGRGGRVERRSVRHVRRVRRGREDGRYGRVELVRPGAPVGELGFLGRDPGVDDRDVGQEIDLRGARQVAGLPLLEEQAAAVPVPEDMEVRAARLDELPGERDSGRPW